MIRRGTGKCIVLGLLILLAAFFSFNYLIIKQLDAPTKSAQLQVPIHQRIVDNVNTLEIEYLEKNAQYEDVFYRYQMIFSHGIRPLWSKSPSQLWKLVNRWPEENRVYPLYQPLVGEVIRALQTDPVQRVDISPKGTQLKLQLLLSGNQTVIFKPKWYERERVIEGAVYAGKDRFNSEIAAFYLGSLLHLNWTPIAVGRKFSAQEMHRLSSERLQKTFVVNKTSVCFYGQCHYCNKRELVCGHQHQQYEVEGVLLYVIPGQLTKQRSPWQRTYKEGVPAEWELKPDYCDVHVKKQLSGTRLLDLVDGAVFDFLIQNGDRHHYETREERLLLLDNGKGFGNPNKDFIDILAPLYQCCTIRLTTYERLLLFTGGKLAATLREISRNDWASPILTEAHYKALDRRLLLVLSAIDLCRRRVGKEMFVK